MVSHSRLGTLDSFSSVAAISISRSLAMVIPFKARSLLSAKNTRVLTIACAVYVAVMIVHVTLSYGFVTFPNGVTACSAYVTGSTSAGTYYFSRIRPWQVGSH